MKTLIKSFNLNSHLSLHLRFVPCFIQKNRYCLFTNAGYTISRFLVLHKEEQNELDECYLSFTHKMTMKISPVTDFFVSPSSTKHVLLVLPHKATISLSFLSARMPRLVPSRSKTLQPPVYEQGCTHFNKPT